jgi:hypothetical protein
MLDRVVSESSAPVRFFYRIKDGFCDTKLLAGAVPLQHEGTARVTGHHSVEKLFTVPAPRVRIVVARIESMNRGR